jgi:hypothetical protein
MTTIERRSKTMKKFILLTALLSSVSLAAACGGEGETTENESKRAAPAAASNAAADSGAVDNRAVSNRAPARRGDDDADEAARPAEANTNAKAERYGKTKKDADDLRPANGNQSRKGDRDDARREAEEDRSRDRDDDDR